MHTPADLPDREEAAAALPRAKPWWLLCLAVAAVVAAAAVAVPLATAGGSDDPARTGAPTASHWGHGDWRWVSYRDVEVKAPIAWRFDYDASRPDCISSGDAHDPWARDVPHAPYVMVGVPARVVPLVGCFHDHRPGDPAPAFGELPFSFWQPFVKLDEPRPDLDHPDRKDGQWAYRGWRLTRTTTHGVQITVLSPPADPSLGGDVVASVRQVAVTALGCDPGSPVQSERFAKPGGAPIPAADDVDAVAICEYTRSAGHAGLDGSRRIVGERARDLVRAIHASPAGAGPDRPAHCVSSMYGDHAIALRFFGNQDDTRHPLAEAFAYYDWCFGNGIVGSDGTRQLTATTCPTLFAEPPISFWSGSAELFGICHPSR